MSSKSERMIFFGRKDDFVYFAEQFEVCMHSLKLGKVLTGDVTNEDYIPTVRNDASEQQRAQAVNKGREELEKKKDLMVRACSSVR